MWIILAVVVLLLLLLALLIFMKIGNSLGVARIERRYPAPSPGGIVFYGASNFTLWREMGQDMQPYVVQNHGFGGSADNDLMKYAPRIFYPYRPKIAVFQSGSNDFALGMTTEEVTANKDKMYSMFRAELPDTVFAVLSMLPLPKRTRYWQQSVAVNNYLRAYCETHENMFFVDATESMTTPEGAFRPEYFRRDGIHLNREGQLVWGGLIKKTLDDIFRVQ